MSVIVLPLYFLFSEKLFFYFQDTLTFTNQSSDSSRIIQIGLLLEYPVHLIKGPTLLQCIFFAWPPSVNIVAFAFSLYS